MPAKTEETVWALFGSASVCKQVSVLFGLSLMDGGGPVVGSVVAVVVVVVAVVDGDALAAVLVAVIVALVEG